MSAGEFTKFFGEASSTLIAKVDDFVKGAVDKIDGLTPEGVFSICRVVPVGCSQAVDSAANYGFSLRLSQPEAFQIPCHQVTTGPHLVTGKKKTYWLGSYP